MRHVLFVPSWFPRVGSHTGAYMLEQAQGLARQGLKVSVLQLERGSFLQAVQERKKPVPVEFVKGLLFCKARFVSILPLRFFPAINRLLMLALVRFKLRLYFSKQGKPDLIHLHSVSNDAFVSFDIARYFRIPLVITEHYSSFRAAEGKLFIPLSNEEEVRRGVQSAALRLSVSRAAAEIHTNYFGASFEVLANPVSNVFLDSPLPAFPKQQEPFVFLCVGALEEHKGQDMLLRAFARAFGSAEHRILKFVGKGSQKQRLMLLAEELGLGAKVQFVDSSSRSELVWIMDTSHVMISASKYETFGLTLAESLFRGNPVVATRSGGPEEIVNESNGFLCEKEEENDLAEKLILIQKEYGKFDPEKIIREARLKYSEAHIIQELIKKYNHILKL